MNKKLTILMSLLVLAGCAGKKVEYTYPLARSDQRAKDIGSLVNNDQGGGINLLSIGKKSEEKSSTVNQVLWQAALDVISFMPLQQSDAAGGVILTDWYSDPKAPNEKFKMNVMISGGELSANGVKVVVFKQELNKKNEWSSAVVSDKMAQDLEERIINKAKQLKLKHPVN